MYDSGITVQDLIASVREEADISVDIPVLSWYRWYNACEQFLYSEFFNERAVVDIDYDIVTDNVVYLEAFEKKTGCDRIKFDDVVSVYADCVELDRTSEEYARIMYDKPCYWNCNDNIGINIHGCEYSKICIVYRVRPNLKRASEEAMVNVPIEFVDLICAKLRGEAYKIANEDGLSAKWLNDYNSQLENLKIWCSERNVRYGE